MGDKSTNKHDLTSQHSICVAIKHQGTLNMEKMLTYQSVCVCVREGARLNEELKSSIKILDHSSVFKTFIQNCAYVRPLPLTIIVSKSLSVIKVVYQYNQSIYKVILTNLSSPHLRYRCSRTCLFKETQARTWNRILDPNTC